MALTVAAGDVSDFLEGKAGVADSSDVRPPFPTAMIRIGWLTNSSGVRHLCYYDPVADKITYQDQSGQVAPSLHR
jgi:hypothetical protein